MASGEVKNSAVSCQNYIYANGGEKIPKDSKKAKDEKKLWVNQEDNSNALACQAEAEKSGTVHSVDQHMFLPNKDSLEGMVVVSYSVNPVEGCDAFKLEKDGEIHIGRWGEDFRECRYGLSRILDGRAGYEWELPTVDHPETIKFTLVKKSGTK